MSITLTSMADVPGLLRGEDTPTPPASNDGPTLDKTFDSMETSNPSTPTRHSFAGLSGQRPLPNDFAEKGADDRSEIAESVQSEQGQDMDDDIDMGEADADTVVDDDGSDNESMTSESRPSKKKKGQRFFCTEFPPCQLSFTRSEHLARHIRKHTGERPFQCHCSRRFSRLDNLRQHAQTVHVNEEIPGDSLAATSTRFQRQIRTDRVRPTSSRSRGSTMTGGQTPTHRHSRNLSTSSIGSVASNFTVSEESRRRPPTLAIATDNLKRPHDMTEGYHGSQQYYSQSGMSTPVSQASFSHIGSPGYSSGCASPSSTISRSSYYNGARHIRRLSVPTGPNPFSSANAPYAPGYYTPVSSHASIYSNNTSGYASPTSSILSPSRQESESDIEYRRRTWHPSTQSNYSQRPATSGLSYHQTPDEPMPALSDQPAASQVTRLPGIESFDHVPPVPTRPQTDTMMLNSISRPLSSTFESGIQQGLNRLDITANGPAEPQRQYAQVLPPQMGHMPMASTGQRPHHHHHMSMPDVPVTPRRNKRQAWYGGPIGPSTALLNPPHESNRPSPEESGSSDGGAPYSSQDYRSHSTIHEGEPKSFQFPGPPQAQPPHQYGYPQDYLQKPVMPARADSGLGPFIPGAPTAAPPQQHIPQPQTYHLQAGHDARFANGSMHARPEHPVNDMGRLEALVAVATSENRAVEEQR